ncbi:PREDICTED: phosphatidate cytidylyltransferase, mitochondrial isoform X4 [Haliaeetus leucocephalus]|uniref:phosphatidate cytidylyltransferase, mitochondrial isoform X4 n=1 Tax=Haliaeetus leucocephalus TaxID=52644 RepID=UPI00053CCAB2|nr:PREDICTED: phosphatidate cytidylyltransferase, mitochondrial isoform X4 [Haliaeetus leucocephalus]
MALPVLSSSGVKFRRVLAHFPQELSLAFAYGSGVFRQAGASAGHGEMIKYGVISTDTLIDDLLHWKTLYVAGRLQKPVKILTQNENSKLQAALVSNLKSAVTAAFLMLPESFSEEDLYMQIAGLSYSGDFRMVIGEDRSKVQNIVKPNVPHFQKLYSNILQDCPQVVYKHHLGRLEIDKSPEGQFTQLMALPRTLQQKITSLVDPPGKNRDVEEILLQVAHDPDCGFVVHQGISGIVRSSSIVQSAKTILTAGMLGGKFLRTENTDPSGRNRPQQIQSLRTNEQQVKRFRMES